MKRCALIVSTIFLLAPFLFVSAYAQEDMRIIANDIFQDPIRVPAIFVHDRHNESAEIEACSRCHHVFESGKGPIVCGQCHKK